MSSPGDAPPTEPEPSSENGEKDPHWKTKLWVEAIARGIGPAAIAAMIGLVGYWGSQRMEDANLRLRTIADATQHANAIIQITSRQKALDVDIGMRLLENVLEDIVEPPDDDGGTPSERDVLMLELVALNLWDVPVHLKPLYKAIDQRIVARASSANADEERARYDTLRSKLRDAARAVARKQAFRLASDGGIDIPRLHLAAGDSHEFSEVVFGTEGRLALRVVEVLPDEAHVVLVFADRFETLEYGPFSVTYFDAPLIDNAKHGALRIAVVLLGTTLPEAGTAKQKAQASLRVIVFDDDLATDRIDVQEMTRDLKRSRP